MFVYYLCLIGVSPFFLEVESVNADVELFSMAIICLGALSIAMPLGVLILSLDVSLLEESKLLLFDSACI